MMTDDMELVREFARHHSEEAFATLVSRHVNLVYSAALRRLRDPHLAKEVTQATFIILARKAGSLSPKTVLSAWLCRTAQYAAADTLKSERRRQLRDQEIHMQSALNPPSLESETKAWTDIAPLLDVAMGQLGEKDHAAIVLRYFEGKDLKLVGVALGVSENAAKTRVCRALEKLRQHFNRRGIALSSVALGAVVAANSIQAAPIGLATSVTVAAVQGTVTTASTLTLIKSTLKTMAWTKLKTAVVVGAVAVITVGTATVTIRRANTAATESTFTFAGYSTPEATVQSLIWAASTGDIENFLAGFTPQEGERFRRKIVAPKSDDEIRRRAIALAKGMTGYKITQKEMISEDEVRVHVVAPASPEGLPGGSTIIIMKRIGGEWKRDGEID